MGNHTPTYDFTGEDEVRHTLYVMNEPLKVQEVTRLFRQVPQLYIADGHHRCEAAYQVAKQLALEKVRREPRNTIMSCQLSFRHPCFISCLIIV